MKKILVTYGGTRVKIDNVRSISNFSTGATGKVIADHLRDKHDVIVLKSISSDNPAQNVQVYNYDTFEDFNTMIFDIIEKHNIDTLIQCAAVSDFVLDSIHTEGGQTSSSKKIESNVLLTLNLRPAPKIIKTVSSKYDMNIIAFKLTDELSALEEENAVKKVLKNGAKYVVHNDINDICSSKHNFKLYGKNGVLGEGATKSDMALALDKVIEGSL